MCDTFVAVGPTTDDRSVIFGKNSDREPNEAQILEFHPPAEYSKGEKVQCTYIAITQATKTHGVILSRPFWMWGAEMGANDCGVVIGNEAVWTKMPIDKEGGLTGMDLLRLALERGNTAEEALEVMIGLLSDHGQGGICGFEDKKMAYHNSYIIADPQDAWVFETAGYLWAARRVSGYYSISNALTIGEEIDRQHPELIGYAKKKGWLKKGQDFNFANVYSDWFFTTFSASARRQGRSSCLLEERKSKFNISTAIGILRDHETVSGNYSPDSHLLGNRICAHAGNSISRNASQTVGSMAAHLKKDEQVYWVTGTAAPCTGIFKPVWMYGQVVPGIGAAPGGKYDTESLWWQHERLHRSVLMDYNHRLAAYRKERDELEKSFMNRADKAIGAERYACTDLSFRQSREATDRWLEIVRNLPGSRRPGYIYRRFWKQQNVKAGIAIF